jgi:uncharacterized protein YjbI with pentapeptide repeats
VTGSCSRRTCLTPTIMTVNVEGWDVSPLPSHPQVLQSANLSGANLRDASLPSARLSWAQLHQVIMNLQCPSRIITPLLSL